MTKETISKIGFRNLDDSALIFLQARAGQKFTNMQVVEALGTDREQTYKTLERLPKQGRISAYLEKHPKHYYVPTAEQIAEREATVEVRPFRPYTVPSLMAERMAEIQAHRQAHPSFYGSDNN